MKIGEKPRTMLHVAQFYMYISIWNVMKIGEKQRTMLAQTQYSVLSATLRVCVCDARLSNFALVILPGKLITGDIKVLSKINEIFSRLTDPTFWTVCNRNQTIILSRPYVPFMLTCECWTHSLKALWNNHYLCEWPVIIKLCCDILFTYESDIFLSLSECEHSLISR